MTIIQPDLNFYPVLAHDAPPTEATLKLREKFKIDPKTGYPEFYNWRGMARLGPEIRPEDPFLKLPPYEPRYSYAYKFLMHSLVSAIGLGGHYVLAITTRRPTWARPQFLLINAAVFNGTLYLTQESAIRTQARRHAMVVDYVKKHPERFETEKRYKCRELLFVLNPDR